MKVSSYLKPIHEQWEWQHEGACVGESTEEFFLDYNLRGVAKRKKEIKAISICNSCPVKMQCLEHALNTPEVYGVWGGMTEEQRNTILRKRGVKFEYLRV
jgi:WhiB family redox-sensing transcriptional regulator